MDTGKSRMQPLLIVEGNIGAGKSVFLNILKKDLNLDIIPEPTNKWQKVEQQGNILDLFYKDTKRWAYTFQSFAFVTRIQNYLTHCSISTKTQPRALERSVYCDRYCFAKNCYERGTMTALEWQIYKEWFSWLVGNYTPQPHGFIYLQAHPNVCFKRLKKRNRSEESEVTLDYLESLHFKHEEWLIEKHDLESSIADVPILVLDCNQEFESNQKMRDHLVSQVATFIHNLTPQSLHSSAINATNQIQL